MSSRLTKLFVVLALLAIAGCSTHVTVKGNYPSPLSTEIPATAGLLFNPEFQTYAYMEDGDTGEVTINFGDAQMRLFSTVFEGIFSRSILLQSMPNEALPVDSPTSLNVTPTVDLVVVPHVEEVQIAQPHDNQLEVYEVWIKFNLQVFDGQGEPIADWIMTSYGKTPSRTLTSSSEALNQASIVALRDAGARIATSFTRVPEINLWLSQRIPQTQADATAAQEGLL